MALGFYFPFRTQSKAPEKRRRRAPADEPMKEQEAELRSEEVEQALAWRTQQGALGVASEPDSEGCAPYDREVNHQGAVDVPLLVELCQAVFDGARALVQGSVDRGTSERVDALVDLGSGVLAHAVAVGRDAVRFVLHAHTKQQRPCQNA